MNFCYVLGVISLVLYLKRQALKRKLIRWLITEANAQSSWTLINSKLGRIQYSKDGTTYQLYVPYDRRLLFSMTNTRVYLLFQEPIGSQIPPESIDITQQPGIPYTATASMMGGVGLAVVTENGIHFLKADEPIKLKTPFHSD